MIQTPPIEGAVFFRVDSSARIGSGHLRRCLTLAETLRAAGHRCIFISRVHPDNLNDDVRRAGFELIELAAPSGSSGDGYAAWLGVSQNADAKESTAAITATCPAIAAIVDHYGLDEQWERAVRPSVPRIMAIDDLANRRHDVDILLDVTPGNSSRYASLVPEGAKLLLGPTFALLRPDFRKLRRISPVRTGEIRRVFIAFGAVDADDWSGAAVDAVRDALGRECEIDVVLGRIAPHRHVMQARALADDRLTLHVDVSDVASLMVGADLAIGAGGTTSWERACLGLPTLLCAIADNQRASQAALAAEGCAIAVHGDRTAFPNEVRKLLSLLASQPGLIRLASEKARDLVDGRGALRVVNFLVPPALTCRRARHGDALDVWRWRNGERVRLVSRDSAPIPWDVHQVWFARALTDGKTILLICEEQGAPVAVVRFDVAEASAEISIYLTPSSGGRGLGAMVLRAAEEWLRTTHPAVLRIDAAIMPGNAASIAAFHEAGYVSRLIQYQRDLCSDINS